MSFIKGLKEPTKPETVHTIDFQEVTNMFIKALDEWEGDNASSIEHVQKTSFAPSGLGYGSGRCPRRWYYAFQGAEWDRTVKATDIRNMDNGTYRHDYLERMLNLSKMAIETENEFWYDDPPIHGFIDAIVEWDGLPWVVEFKTTKTEWFDYRRKQMKPPFYNLLQILVYMKVKDIPRGMLIYEDKNTFKRTGIAIEWNERYSEYMDKVFSWMRYVYEITEGDDPKLPERNFSKSSRECTDCPVRATCWTDDREPDLKVKSLPKIKI